MANKIYHTSSRCGSGKTYSTLKKLVGSNNYIIFSSKTIDLSRQSFSDFRKMGGIGRRVDSTTTKDVPRSLNQLLETFTENKCDPNTGAININFIGVLFTTHAGLLNVNPIVLNKCHIIYDEIPSILIKYISLKFNCKSAPKFFNTWISRTESLYKGYQKAALKDEYRDDARQLISEMKSGKSSTYSHSVHDILQLMLDNFDILYSVATSEDSETYHNYQSIEKSKLHTIFLQAKNITILSSNLKDSLLGVTLENIFNFNIIEYVTNLEKKHKQKITLFPYLKSGSWSSAKRNGSLSDLTGDQSLESFSGVDGIQKFALDVLKDKFLLFKNKKDHMLSELADAEVIELGCSVHGMNSYKTFNKAAFCASLRPTPVELRALKMFMNDNCFTKLNVDELIMMERCYETAYQCLARTGIRNPAENDENEYLFVVPDVATAEYIKKYFEPGNVKIDTSKSIIPMDKIIKDERKSQRLSIATSILTDKKNKINSMPNILKSHNTSPRTMNRYRSEFKQELKERGLI